MTAEEKAVQAVREAINEARLDELSQVKDIISLHRLEHGDNESRS